MALKKIVLFLSTCLATVNICHSHVVTMLAGGLGHSALSTTSQMLEVPGLGPEDLLLKADFI